MSRARRVWDFLDRFGWIIAIIFVLIGFRTLHNQGQTIGRQVKTVASLQRELHAQVQNEANSRSEQTAATVNARFANCESGNTLRRALRVNVEQGQRSLPLLLELLPSLNTPKVLKLNQQSVEYQIKAFKLLDCKTYSEEILPGHSP
jgi:Sec-independent protein translocase protein TatA